MPDTRRENNRDGVAPLLVAWLMALAILASSIVPMTLAGIRDATLFDNDDAMRLVQMREWLNGRGWYDLDESRIDPPGGMLSHWPRLVEIPLAGAILGLDLFVERDLAERIGVAVWPSVLLAALVLGLLILARRLVAPPTLIAAAVIIAMNPLLQFQFAPGRIDHHGVQMLLSLALAIATIRALVDGSRHAAAAAGTVGALMLAIGLETLPLVAAAAALFGAASIVRGDAARRPVASFGMALALAAPALFAATTAPSRWGVTACDVLSAPWLLLACGGGLALAGLASIAAPARPSHRALFAFTGGSAVVAIFLAYWPHCLLGPYADVDPLVREIWLSDVGEATPLVSLVAANPTQFLFFLVFPLVGWLALGIAAYRERKSAPEFALIFGFATMALTVAFGSMRGVPFASIFGLFGWLYLFDRAIAGPRIGLRNAVVALAVILGALPFLWYALGATLEDDAAQAAQIENCNARADMAALASEPPGLVLAPLRLGPRILVATGHDILAAPYHRNNRGNRFALETLTADADAAHRRIEERGVRYVAVCLADSDLPHLIAYRPDSFLKMLVDGDAPAWLSALPAHGPIRAWRVVE